MKQISDFEPLLLAEQTLLNVCKTGKLATIGNGNRPSEKTANNEIRAEFLRALILTEKDIDPKGVWFQGVYVSGGFDFESCETNLPFYFQNSFFEEKIVLMRSKIRLLSLNGSEASKGISASGLKCEGSVFLKDGFNAKGQVDFGSAQIGSNLECINGTFENPNGYALNCNRAKIEGSAFLTDGFNAKGQVNFVAAHIGSSLICMDTKIDGVLYLNSAKVKDLRDGEIFWNYEGLVSVSLDGFVYGHIHGFFQAEKRKQWLAKMPKSEFKPQPYKQLEKVLRDMGHVDDAAEIMIEYHDKRSQDFGRFKKFFFSAYKLFSNYGYSPSKVVKWMLGVWLTCGVLYWHAANVGVFAPSNPIAFQYTDYNCTPNQNGANFWKIEKDKTKNWYYSSLKGEYTTFQPFAYSLDVILPVVDLYVEKDWGVYIPTPSGYFDWLNPTTITFNHIVRLIVWLEILFGWALSLILVAILSGLAKNEKD